MKCDLELVALFDNTVIEQGVFLRNDFLVDRTADFHFNVSGCSVSFSSANELNTAAACAPLLYV